jgi:hypothetical protein
MRTWVIVFRINGKADSRIITAESLEEAYYQFMGAFPSAEINGVFEVAL